MDLENYQVIVLWSYSQGNLLDYELAVDSLYCLRYYFVMEYRDVDRRRRLMEKYSGVLGMGIFAAVGALVVGAGFRSVSFTISFYSSLNPILQLVFCIFGCIGSLLIGYSLLFYLPGKWRLGNGYRAIVSLLTLAFFVTCLFPNDPDALFGHFLRLLSL